MAKIAKRDYSRARDNWARRGNRAERVEQTGGTVAGGAGATIGLAALRDAAVKDHPSMETKLARTGAKIGPRAAATLTHGKPGLKVLSAAVGGGALAAGGRRAKKVARKREDRYAAMTVAKALTERQKAGVGAGAAVGAGLVARRGGKKLIATGYKTAKKADRMAEMTNDPASHVHQYIRGGRVGMAEASQRTGTKALKQVLGGAAVKGAGEGAILGGAVTGAANGVDALGHRKTVRKSFAEPGGAMHAADLEIAKALSAGNESRALHLAYEAGRPDTRIRAANLVMRSRANATGQKKDVAGAYAARKKRKVAVAVERARQGQKYSLVKGLVKPDDKSIKRAKSVQGKLGTAAAVTGLAAAGTKVGGKALPKMMRSIGAVGGRAGSYQKHLDRTADALLYGATALGGASGIHASQIASAEGKQRKPKVR